MKFPIYLDNHATTQVDPEVVEEMLPYFTEKFGNASSKIHSFGWKADSAVENARRRIANLIKASKEEIIFTSGATESINLVHFGIAQSYFTKGKHIITTNIEHSAVMDSLKILEQKGFEITYLKVDANGLINLDQLNNSIKNSTILVSIMTANNEIGTINDVEAVGKICNEKDVIFHTDAAQAIGKIEFDSTIINADLVSFSSHKLYGPKGIGALFIRNKSPKTNITPLLFGGGHEKGLRSGTLNVPAIVGFGKAAELCSMNKKVEQKRIEFLRNKLLNGLKEKVEGIEINGSMEKRLANNLNISFKFVRSDTLISEVRDIAVSAGSACSSESLKPSHVLKALGKSDETAFSSIRFGIGRFNTEEEINYAIEKISSAVKMLREKSPAYNLYRESLVN